MVLVPESELYHRIKLAQTCPEAKEEVYTDARLRSVLEESNLPMDVKTKLIAELAQKARGLRAQHTHAEEYPIGSYRPNSTIPSYEEEIEDAFADADDGLTVDEIKNLVPDAVAKKSYRLLKYVDSQGNMVNWDQQGRVTIDNVGVPNSSIVDLVRYAVKSSAQAQHTNQPPGWEKFAAKLAQINVPSTLAPQARPVIEHAKLPTQKRSPARIRSPYMTRKRKKVEPFDASSSAPVAAKGWLSFGN